MAFNFGNFVGDIGTKLGLPEFGISEKLGGTPISPLSGPISTTPQQQTPSFPQAEGIATGATGGQILGAQAPAGGGAGVGQQAAGQQTASAEAPLEQAPAEPEFDFDSLIAPSLEALGQAEQASRAETDANLAGIDSNLESAVSGQEGELSRREGLYEQQQTREEGRIGEAVADTQSEGTGAINEAQRGASQLLQGIQSRFGGTTGTGRFASEILGAQTTKNIAGVRQQVIKTIGTLRARLQETVNQIDMEVQNTRDIAQQNIADAKRQAETLKQQARSGLQKALAEIGSRRGELGSRKAEFVFQAIQDHRNTVNEINARNTEFEQRLFQSQQQAEQKLSQAKDVSVKNMETDLARNAITLQKMTAGGFTSTPEQQESVLRTGQLDEGESGGLTPIGAGTLSEDLTKELTGGI